MRIIEMRLGESGSTVVELHPDITVVSGLPDLLRQAVVEVVETICAGGQPSVRTVVEAHDLLMDVSPVVTEVLGLGRTGTDVVLRSSDLPRADHAGRGDGPVVDPVAVERAQERRAGRQADLVAARAEAERARALLESARADAEESISARADAEAEVESATGEVDRVGAELTALGPRPSYQDADVDPEIVAAESAVEEADRDFAVQVVALDELRHLGPDVAAAQAALERARAALDEIVADRPDASDTPLPASVDEELDRARRALAAAEAEAAEAAAAGDRSPGVVDVQRALAALEEALADVEQRRERARTSLAGSDDPRLAQARADHHAAAHAVAEAEARARPLKLAPSDIEEIEASAAEVSDLEARASRPIGGALARRGLAKARSDLDELLSRHGLPSYAAFLMRTSMAEVDPSAHAVVLRARETLAEAEGRLEALEEMALAAVHDDEGDAAVSTTAARLADLLDSLEVPHDGPDGAGVVDVARRWLEMMEGVDDELTEILERVASRRAAVESAAAARQAAMDEATARVREAMAVWDARQAAAKQAVEDAADAVAAAQAAAAEHDAAVADEENRLQLARARVDEAEEQASAVRRRAEKTAQEQAARIEAAVRRHDAERERIEGVQRAAVDRLETARARLASLEIDDDLEQARADAAVADGRAASSASRLAEAENALARAEAGEVSLTDVDNNDIEVYLLARLAAQRSVGRAGSMPFVVDGALDVLDPRQRAPVLELIERMSSAVQVLVFSDEDAVAAWAEDLGLRRALAVRR